MDALGANIKIARKTAKLSQTELAKRIGKTLSTVQKYEAGKTVPPLEVLEEIASVLHVPVSEIYNHDEVPASSNKFSDQFAGVLSSHGAQFDAVISAKYSKICITDIKLHSAQHPDEPDLGAEEQNNDGEFVARADRIIQRAITAADSALDAITKNLDDDLENMMHSYALGYFSSCDDDNVGNSNRADYLYDLYGDDPEFVFHGLKVVKNE